MVDLDFVKLMIRIIFSVLNYTGLSKKNRLPNNLYNEFYKLHMPSHLINLTSMPLHYIGLMSGTSLDGIDGVLVQINDTDAPLRLNTIATTTLAFEPILRDELLALQHPCDNELHRSQVAGVALAQHYAQLVQHLLKTAQLTGTDIQAIGAHGQTVRHRPECGYSLQLNHPALLAELTNIPVVADFRSRDIAAGGQGAPLVPAFHHALWQHHHPSHTRLIVNLGGIANITRLPSTDEQHDGFDVIGFDCGPANVLMDGWIQAQHQQAFDADGAWAASGQVDMELLQDCLADDYFQRPAPKSTGRDHFNMSWLAQRLSHHPHLNKAESGADVQATLTELTAITVAQAIGQLRPAQSKVFVKIFVCGGGAKNGYLMQRLAWHLSTALNCTQNEVDLNTTAAIGIDPQWVEAIAFAWLAHQALHRKSANLPAVTGAYGERICGAIYY
jgi:anhydro-N-acetylmuramic acid kinase